MEALKTFETLSDNDKILFFHVLSKAVPGTLSSFSASSLDDKLDTLIGKLKNGDMTSVVPSETLTSDSKAKQKTLDSWLIKKNKSSPSPKNDKTVSEPDFIASCNDKSTDLDVGDKSNRENILNVPILSHEDEILPNKLPSNSPKTNELSKSLRRSKRKNVTFSDIISDDKDAKKIKNNNSSNTLKEPEANNNYDNLEVNKSFIEEEISYNLKKSCNDVLENNVDHNNTTQSIKRHYNLRTKRKISNKAAESALFKKSKTFNAEVMVSEPVYHDQINHLNSNQSLDQSEANKTAEVDYEAFMKIQKDCNQLGLNVLDILLNENLKSILCDYTDTAKNAIFFIGSYSSDTEKVEPIVHMHSDKLELEKQIIELQTKR